MRQNLRCSNERDETLKSSQCRRFAEGGWRDLTLVRDTLAQVRRQTEEGIEHLGEEKTALARNWLGPLWVAPPESRKSSHESAIPSTGAGTRSST